jgi:two pore calcium channel protein 1
VLPFFEAPSWCSATVQRGGCGDPRVVMVSNVPRLPVVWAGGAELVVLSTICAEAVLKHRYMGTERFLRDWWHVVQMLLIIAALAAALVGVVDSSNGTALLVLPLLRPLLFVTLSRKVRGAFVKLVRVVPAFADCALLLCLLVGFFSMLGLLLFDGSAEGAAYFPTLSEGSLSLLITLTTANFPDVMMPAYRKQRTACLFFVAFLM